jgi:hypothetical protein
MIGRSNNNEKRPIKPMYTPPEYIRTELVMAIKIAEIQGGSFGWKNARRYMEINGKVIKLT